MSGLSTARSHDRIRNRDAISLRYSRSEERIDFHRVSTPDLHRQRAKELLRRHPELRSLMRPDPWAGVVMFFLTLLQLAIALALSRFGASIGFTLATAFLIGAVLNHWLAMGVHEASHGLVFRKPWANRAVSLLANLPILLPGSMSFFRHHPKHHRYLGDPRRDNDLPTQWEARVTSNIWYRKLLWLLLFPVFGAAFRGFLVRPNRYECLNFSINLAFAAWVFHAFGGLPLIYWAASTYAGFGLHPVAGHWIHEHYLWDGKQETTSYYGPLNLFTFNVGYHTEHHDLPNIPGRFLPRLRATALEFYDGRGADTSWLLIWARFVMNPRMSHYSRIVRDA